MNLKEALERVNLLLLTTKISQDGRFVMKPLSQKDHDAITIIAKELRGSGKRKITEKLDAELWYNLGIICHNQKMLDEAEYFFTASINLDSTFQGSWYFLGLVLDSNRTPPRFEEAEPALRRAIELAPEFGDAWTVLGYNLGHLKRPKESIEAYQRALQLQPMEPRAMLGLGAAYFDSGEFRKARDTIQAGLQNIPANHPVRKTMLETLEEINVKIESLEQKEKQNPSRSDENQGSESVPPNLSSITRYFASLADLNECMQAALLAQQGEVDAAIIMLRNILQVHPRNLTARITLIQLYIQVSNFSEAEKSAREAVAHWPAEAEPWEHLGNILAFQGKQSAALDAFRTAVKFKSKIPMAWCSIGTILTIHGHYDEAERAFRTALEQDPQCGIAILFLSYIAQKKGKPSEARALYDRVEAIMPPDPHKQANLYNLYAWNLYLLNTGDNNINTMALELADKAIAKERSLPNLDTHACLLSRLNRFKDANVGFLTAIQASHDPSEMSRITWGEFKITLEQLGDRIILAKYEEFFRKYTPAS